MIMANHRRNTHFFCATLLVGLLSATAAFAPPAPPPPLSLDDQPFGVVFLADEEAVELVLAEDCQDYEGRIALKVINNVPLNITAEVTPADNSGLPNSWSVRLNEPGESQGFHPNIASNKVLGVHKPGAEGDLELCIKVHGVDMNWHTAHRAHTNVPVANISITVVPEI